jgi:hypothetical protein
MYRTVQISDELFWGFNKSVLLTNYTSFNDLIQYIRNELIVFLKANNLLNLVDKAKNIKLHNHHFKLYEQLYKTDEETVIYLCGGNCE